MQSPETSKQPARSLNLLNELPQCDLYHQGALIDLGTGAENSRRSFSAGPFSDAINTVRAGKSTVALFGREVSYTFSVPRESSGLSVAVRGRAGLTDRVNVYLDDERLGAIKLHKGQFGVALSPESRRKLAPGLHTVTLRFATRRRSANEEPNVELDWLWLGDRKLLTPTYAPPTPDDIVTDVVLAAQPRRSVVLRAPASVRCVVRPGHQEELELHLGYWGEGGGTAQVRALIENEAPVVLAEHTVRGGEHATWQPLSLDLSRFQGRVVALELAAIQASGGGRIAFGEPVLKARIEPVLPPAAQNVVLVLMSGLAHNALPPWGSAQGFRGMTELARQGVTFNGYRTRTTSTAAAVASILTGLPPRLHTVEDSLAKLPNSIFTLAEMLKQHGVQGALFTGVPLSFPAFGFDRGWDRFVAVSPVLDLPVTEPFTAATNWLTEQLELSPSGRRLLVIHARGGHPPWDLSREETAGLPPEEYAGVLEARRGGIILAQLRARAQEHRRRLRPEDWTRLHALQALTLRRQDQAMARLIDLLQEREQWEQTLFIFAGDSAMGDPPHIPFGTADLSEDRLLTPLLVKFPKALHGGAQVTAPCTSEDIARTISDALGAVAEKQILGENLASAAAGLEPPGGRPLVALMGNQFSTRFGSWLLLGEFGNVPRLCQLEVDPACASDLFATHAISAGALWRGTFEASQMQPSAERERAVIDDDTRAALTVWGE